jgi:hypothetical protein
MVPKHVSSGGVGMPEASRRKTAPVSFSFCKCASPELVSYSFSESFAIEERRNCQERLLLLADARCMWVSKKRVSFYLVRLCPLVNVLGLSLKLLLGQDGVLFELGNVDILSGLVLLLFGGTALLRLRSIRTLQGAREECKGFA